MRVLFCSSEIYPYVKTGGLGDVTAALPPALIEAGMDVRFYLPGYESLLDQLKGAKTIASFPIYLGEKDVRILKGALSNGIVTYVLDAPGFWDRSSAYVDETGHDWADNYSRFAAFCRAAVDLSAFDSDWPAQIIHANDWQCGLMAPYAKLQGPMAAKTVMTIHNIAYQGLFPPHILQSIGVPADMFHMSGLEFYNKVGYLKAGLAYSDHITTVSPTYAREIQETEQGCGLQGFLKTRSDRISGILNGIDTVIWNPETDPDVSQKYDLKDLKKRSLNKKTLLKRFGLPEDLQRPLFAVISRLGYQKGFDLLLQAMPRLLELGGNLILLGSGDKDLENAFVRLAAGNPGRVAVHIGYDETLAHHMQAGSDIIVMPSRSEPCGLVQLYAMRYGALPFVHKTGGLADTVTDVGQPDPTGFVFEDANVNSLRAKLDSIFETYKRPELWEAMQRRAMKNDWSWSIPARQYQNLYKSLLK